MPRSRKQTTAGTKASFPGFIEPALATSIEKPPKGARWQHSLHNRAEANEHNEQLEQICQSTIGGELVDGPKAYRADDGDN
jgi:hypothetical protein